MCRIWKWNDSAHFFQQRFNWLIEKSWWIAKVCTFLLLTKTSVQILLFLNFFLLFFCELNNIRFCWIYLFSVFFCLVGLTLCSIFLFYSFLTNILWIYGRKKYLSLSVDSLIFIVYSSNSIAILAHLFIFKISIIFFVFKTIISWD